jgi:hypothetical protein
MQHRSRARFPRTHVHAHDECTVCEPGPTVFSVEYTSLANSAMVDGRSKRPVHTSIGGLPLLSCSTSDVCVTMTRRRAAAMDHVHVKAVQWQMAPRSPMGCQVYACIQ